MIKTLIKLKRIFKFTSHDLSTPQGKSDERYRRIILTGGSAAIVKIFSVIINLITIPLTVNYLGAERYGLWMTISSILALMSFADLGLGNGLLNAISRANGKGSIVEARIAVSSTFFMLLGISILLLLTFITVYSFISWDRVFNVVTPIAIAESGPTMMVLIFSFLINMPLGVIQRIQNGYQEGYKNQIWLIAGSLLSFFGLLISIYFEAGLPWLVLSFSCGQIISTIANGLYMFSRKRKEIAPKFSFFEFNVSKKLIKMGLVFFTLGLFTLIGNSSDNIILAHTLGAKSVAGYEIVKKIFMVSMLTQFVIEPLWPAFGEAIEKGDYSWAKKTLTKALLYSLCISSIITLPLMLFGRQIISFWLGEEFIPSWSLLIGFYFFTFLANYGGVISAFLNSGELIAKQTIMIGLGATASIILKFYLATLMGPAGIIWATIIGYSLFYVWPSYNLAFSYFKKNS